jgi:hypothetical protein
VVYGNKWGATGPVVSRVVALSVKWAIAAAGEMRRFLRTTPKLPRVN